MMKGPVTLENANVEMPLSFPGGWWEDGWPMRSANIQWSARGLSYELGPRAYYMLLAENRSQTWPPALEDLERQRAGL